MKLAVRGFGLFVVLRCAHGFGLLSFWQLIVYKQCILIPIELTLVDVPVSSLQTSTEFFFLTPASLKTTSQALFLQLRPLVPLYVPHFGHFRTPRIVDFPKSDRRSFAFLWESGSTEKWYMLVVSYYRELEKPRLIWLMTGVVTAWTLINTVDNWSKWN